MKTHIFTIRGFPIFIDNANPKAPEISWIAKASIDGDGTGPSHGDPDYQDDTSLHEKHAALDADTDIYAVVPPEIRDCVEEPVLGCQGFATYAGKSSPFVVGDIGGANNLGEISIALAKALNIPWSPTTGGVAEGVSYMIHPGQPANVNGKIYDLQTAKGVEIPTPEPAPTSEQMASTFDPVAPVPTPVSTDSLGQPIFEQTAAPVAPSPILAQPSVV
jgi:hypothetical protein